MVRHMFGYSDMHSTTYNEVFDYYQVIGCKKNPACITPCTRKDNPLPYYRDYSECHETRLYFKGVELSELRPYLQAFRQLVQCVGCSHPPSWRLVACPKF